MTQVSKDHSEFEIMKNYGLVKEEEYYSSNLCNSLTRHLGNIERGECLQPFVSENLKMEQDDMFLLCSDGLCSVLRKEQMLEYICQKGSLRKRCIELVKGALAAGSEDNVTAILIQCNL